MSSQEDESILTERSLGGLGLFRKRPAAKPGVALVLYRHGRPLVCLLPGDELTTGEAVFGRYERAYEVDISQKTLEFACTLPSQNPSLEFRAKIKLAYAVDDPTKIVEYQVKDPHIVLEPLVTRVLRNVSREFQIDQILEAEEALVRAIEGRRFKEGLGVRSVLVELQLETESQEHMRKMTETRRRTELELADIQSKKTIEAERVKLEEERLKLEEAREDWELRRRQRLVNWYLPLIKQGEWNLLALQLANSPDDIPEVARIMREERKEWVNTQIKLLAKMIDKDAIEGYQLADPAKAYLGRLLEFLSALPGGESVLPSTIQEQLPSGESDEAAEGGQESPTEPEDGRPRRRRRSRRKSTRKEETD